MTALHRCILLMQLLMLDDRAVKVFSASAVMLCLQGTITAKQHCLQVSMTACNSPSRQAMYNT